MSNRFKKVKTVDAPDDGRKAEDQIKDELSDVLEAFKSDQKDEKALFLENTDSEYWIAVCFQTRAQKEEFLRKAKLIQLGDKYLDGEDVAAVMGIELEIKTPRIRKVSIRPKLVKLSE